MNIMIPSKRAIVAATVALSALIIPERSDAVQLTYELRVDPATTTPGLQITNGGHNVTATGPGQVIGLQLYAVVHGADADPTNDGFQAADLSLFAGSFNNDFVAPLITRGTLLGDYTGNPTGGAATLANNNAPWNGVSAQSGYTKNLVSGSTTVGPFDLGSLQSDAPLTLPWFLARSQTATSIFGTALNAQGFTEFLIGHFQFTLSGTAADGQTTGLSALSRNRTVGSVAAKNTNTFKIDSTTVTTALQGNNAQIDYLGVSVLVTVPEPSAIGMLLLGATGLVGFRRFGIRS